jgi:hypothetical protein
MRKGLLVAIMGRREARKLARKAIADEIISRMTSELPSFLIDEFGMDHPVCDVYFEECHRVARWLMKDA